jgi:hypothetical protein
VAAEEIVSGLRAEATFEVVPTTGW